LQALGPAAAVTGHVNRNIDLAARLKKLRRSVGLTF
jgi:hypothetical protein